MLEHKCEVCGRLWRKKLKADGKIVCNKHYTQFKKHGKFMDTSPRTQRDKNEIVVVDNSAYISLYDKQYNVIAKAIIDAEDIPLVKNIKWRLNHNGYVMNNSNHNKRALFLHSVIMNTKKLIDHIDTNPLNNKKENLRIVTKSQNQMNVKYKGYYYIKGKWFAKIKINQKQINLGTYYMEEEAIYARWFAEKILFKEFAYPREEPNIPQERKQQIQEYINQKVQRL